MGEFVMKKSKAIWEPVYRTACMVAAVAAVLFTVMRVALTPIADAAPLAYAFSLCVLLLFVIAVAVYSALAKKEPIVVRGKSAYVSAAAATITGVSFLVYTILSVLNWWLYQAMPYPDKALAAIWLLCVGIRWWCAGKTVKVPMYGLALAPVVWCWVRLIRYITSYVSLGGLFHNVYEIGTMIFETLFFMLLIKVITGVGKQPSRFFMSVSLCTGFFCTISALSQAWFFIVQDAASYSTTLLVTAPDFAVAFLAFAVAIAQSVGIPADAEEEQSIPVTVTKSDEEMEDGDGAEFLLSDEWFTVYDPDDEDEEPDEEE